MSFTRSKTGALLAALAAIALAFTNVLAPLVYEAGSNPPTVLMLRALATVITLGIILTLTGRMHRLSMRDEIRCAISGTLFMFAGFGLLSALAISPPGMVVLVLYLFPILTIILDAIVNRRRVNRKTLLLLLLALFGLALVLGADANELGYKGFLLALLAAISAASTLVWNNKMLAETDPEQITFRMFIVSALVFGAWVIITNDFAIPQSTSGLYQLAFMLFCFALAFLMMFRAVQMAGSINAAMIMNLEPVGTILLSLFIFSHVLSLTQTLGALLVLSAVLFSQLSSRSPNN